MLKGATLGVLDFPGFQGSTLFETPFGAPFTVALFWWGGGGAAFRAGRESPRPEQSAAEYASFAYECVRVTCVCVRVPRLLRTRVCVRCACA